MLVTEFSGFAVVPVIGAALIIWYGRVGWVNRLLSHPAMVYVGKTSYSLYLWHWPVIVLGRTLGGDVPAFALVMLTGLLAVASYHLVEEPTRRRPAVIPAIAGGFICVLAVAAFLAASRAPRYDASRFDTPQTYSRYYDVNPHREETAEVAEMFAAADAPSSIAASDAYRREGIVIGRGDGPPRAVVLGDSHGTMWAHAIRVASEEVGLKVAFYCMGGVDPFMDVPPLRNQRVRKLTAAEKYDYDTARLRHIEQWKPAVVFICARWAIVKPGAGDQLMGFLQRHSEKVVLVEQPPELAGVGDHSVAEVAVFRGVHPKSGSRQYWPVGNVDASEAGCRVLQSLAEKFPECDIMKTRDLFAEENRVWFLDGRSLLYFDDDHLTTAGSLVALPRIRECLSPGDASKASFNQSRPAGPGKR